ncbi:syntaxin-binding protein 5-like isoform X6 [Varroa jacobsoni]|uniref:syntaxin-binding protein 5-like isoform X6 n=1 Tax=Varroa jacobsoni TaxID=62625 RepID=UPI000BF90D62|nr:syntaxin-binding protein 5-like isoform X6 [Varroa jacobsoni]
MGWRSAELLFFNLVGSAVVANREQGRDGNEGRRSVLLTTTMSDKESSGGGGGGGGSSSKEKKKEMKRADTKRSGFFKGVLDNLRSSVTQLPSGGKGPGNAGDVQDIPEDKLRKELFNIEKTARHGFPHNPLAVTYDPIQKLVAVGTHSGTIRILGRPGVEITLQHVLDYPVVQLQFIVNEGLLLSLCADDQIHEWNIKNKTPEIVHSLKFQKERITFFHLPFQSKWLYLGTEGGNVHVVNIDTFSLSGYVINWNKAIEISRKTKPGAVVHLSENPVDSNKLLIGFETGTIVLWDLRSRAAEVRFQYNEALSSVSWHFEGKQFMASHGDGSLTTFNIRQPGKPQSVLYPHARTKTLAQGGGGPDPAGSSPGGATASGSPLVVPSSSRNNLLPITKVQWRITRAGDNYVIFSGGLPFEKGNSEVSTLTVSQGRSTTVLEMESPILDFLTLDESPFAFDTQDPFAVVVLLRSDLVVVDLLTHGYPCFRNPYSMDLHESMVICCQYLADCPGELIPCLYSVGARASAQSRHFSEREWPITGGEWGQGIVSYPEVIITGHADGSVRFWDASSLGFQLLYRLKTSRLFEKLKSDDHPFIVEKMSFDPEGRQLAIAGSSYVALFSFAKAEGSCSVTVLDTPIHFEMEEPAPIEVLPRGQVTSGERMVLRPCPQKWAAGLQPTLVCQFLSSGAGGNADSARHVTCMAVSSAYNLLAFGNDSGLVVVDTVHNTCVLNFATPELYGSADPYQRSPRSPKRQDNGLPDPAESSPDQRADCSFSRSRSSSISSLENVSHEAITCLTFCDTFCSKKGDCSSATPSLWVGTSLGSVLLLPLTLANESRSALASPGSGTLFKLKSPVLCIGFMDSSGAQLVSDGGRLRSVSTSANSHLAVLVSEKLARVVSLPSQNTVIKTNLTDTSFVICADVMQLKSCDVPCLVSYIANGSILIHSLPSLKPVFEDDLQTLVDPKISRIFCLSKNGHGLYMSSPTEFQKFTVSAEFCNQLQELKCTVHTTKEMPEAPKQSFFKGLFGGGPSILDREELFGAAGSGKASKAIARHIPGNAANLEGMKERTGTVAGEVARTRMLILPLIKNCNFKAQKWSQKVFMSIWSDALKSSISLPIKKNCMSSLWPLFPPFH